MNKAILSSLWLSLTGVASCYPQRNQHITTIPFSKIERADLFEKMPDIEKALLNVGAFAVDGLNAEYVRDLESLRDASLNCLEGSVTMKLQDAGIRFSNTRFSDINSEGEDNSSCEEIDVDHIFVTLNQLESKVSDILANIIGDRSHVKNYKQVKIQKLSQLVNNGLFLMITHNAKLPMFLKNFQGRPVSTDHLGPNSVIFLVGQGLVDFLFQDAANTLYSKPQTTAGDVRSVFLSKLSNYKL